MILKIFNKEKKKKKKNQLSLEKNKKNKTNFYSRLFCLAPDDHHLKENLRIR